MSLNLMCRAFNGTHMHVFIHAYVCSLLAVNFVPVHANFSSLVGELLIPSTTVRNAGKTKVSWFLQFLYP